MNEKLRLLLVDDHAVVRNGYRRLLESQEDLTVVGEAASAREALDRQREYLPDLIVLDISLPDIGGVELIGRLVQRDPGCRILVFSMHRDPIFATQYLRAGAIGYVTKSSQPEVMIDAIYRVAAKQQVISPDISSDLALSLVNGASGPVERLSPREFEILQLLLDGCESKEIASRLSISSKTVQNYHYQIKLKLGVKSDIEMMKSAIRLGLFKPY
ncbi:MAG: DNA-binding response regulator [Ectothiorhodospiraceae bacterium]|nr:DNA-binding response regulator [Ectothiorhodospiraceae bacterium]